MRLERKTGLKGRAIGGFAATMLALGTMSPAVAADRYVLEEVEETRVEFGTGWYIRGDLGVSNVGKHVETAITRGADIEADDLSTTFGFRVGAGYHLTPQVRLEGTFDYHSRAESTVEGGINGGCGGIRRIVSPLGTSLSPARVLCVQRDIEAYDSQDLMVNAYYDLSSIGRFTPYVGAGLGATRMNYSSHKDDFVCDPGGDNDLRCDDPDRRLMGLWGAVAESPGVVNEGTSYHLAGSLTLGTAYTLTKNLSVDASYQLSKTFESAMWGGGDAFDVTNADSLRHSVRVGLRYDLW